MKKITIKFVDNQGNLLAKIKKDPNKDYIDDIGCSVGPCVDIGETRRFLRWDEDINSLKEDSILTAVYETIPPFKFKEINGKIYLADTDYRCMHTFYDIPEEWAGKKVYGILPGAFKNVSANAASIYIPKNVKDIQDGAFDSCYNTTLLFENKKPDISDKIANFKPNMYFGVNEDNHFMDEEYEYLITKKGVIVIRCLDAYVATIILDKVDFNGTTYPVIGVNPYIFYSPFCVDLVEMYIPDSIPVEDMLPDYIFNCDVINY